MHAILRPAFALVLVVGLGACSPEPKAQAGEEGARALLNEMLAPSANHAALTAALKPRSEDYAAAFEGDAAKRAEATYSEMWGSGKMVIQPRGGQSELLLVEASTEDLRAGSGRASEFPGGYKEVAPSLKPGLKWYRFKFVKPGDRLGMAFDGLTYVNGRWVIFPKPYRALRG